MHYKYVGDAKAVTHFAERKLKFAPIDKLNDPSELTPVMDRDAAVLSLAHLRKNGFTSEQFAWLQRQCRLIQQLSPASQAVPMPPTAEQARVMLFSRAYDDLDFMEKQLRALVSTIRTGVGVMSVSERYDSLPMWAHYACLAKGFVVALENLQASFGGDETGSLRCIKRVSYADELGSVTFDPSTQDRLFFSKFTDWSYEQEWRIVMDLRHCPLLDGMHLYQTERPHLTQVICGWRVSEEALEALRSEVQGIDPNVTFARAQLHNGRVRLAPLHQR